MTTKRASVLAIGTELTTGQIINKNASSLSERLKKESVLTQLHLTVPDQRDLMLQALDICAQHSDWIFVTGGLGPTSDDFTRDVVANWCGKELVWDDASWNHLTDRLTSRGYVVKDIQKQQCYFPRGARILINAEGTAHGFHVSAKGKEIFVLPGPPREIEACWKAGIQDWLLANTKDLEKYITRSWDTLGLGESDLAVAVEPIIQDLQKTLDRHGNKNDDNRLEVGYRVHLPYVEFKLSFYKKDEALLIPFIEMIDETLAAWTILRDGEDVLKLLGKKIVNEGFTSLSFVDELSGTYLLNRLNGQLKNWIDTHRTLQGSNKNIEFSFSNHWTSLPSQSACVFSLRPLEENLAEVRWTYKGQTRKDVIKTPFTTLNMSERRKQYFAEYALILWNRWLS